MRLVNHYLTDLHQNDHNCRTLLRNSLIDTWIRHDSYLHHSSELRTFIDIRRYADLAHGGVARVVVFLYSPFSSDRALWLHDANIALTASSKCCCKRAA